MSSNVEQIIFKIDLLTCETSIQVEGMEGGSCTETTAPIEAAFGGVSDRKYKPEYRRTRVRSSVQAKVQGS